MGGKRDDGKSGIFGRELPGTGGDLRPSDPPTDPGRHGSPDEPDVEGHLYTGGPKTQGEFARRGPGENPHGDR